VVSGLNPVEIIEIGTIMKSIYLIAAASVALLSVPAIAQSSQPRSNDRLQQILGNLFGQGTTANTSLEAQWRLGRTPIASQRAQFDGRVDADTRSGALTPVAAARLKNDYASVVQLEARYASDGVFTTAERTELNDRYGELTQTLADGGYANPAAPVSSPVSDGRAEFAARVDAAVTARRLTRVAATRLKADHAALVQLEAGYLRDGQLTDIERDTLDERLDALDARVDGITIAATPRSRIDAIARALPASRLSAAAQAQLRVEHGDLGRLAAAYERIAPTADERAYLERRLVDLEARARVVR
jgi:hypothetical protein